MKKTIPIILSALFLFSACSAPSADIEQATASEEIFAEDESEVGILLEEMPEIVFIMIRGANNVDKISGSFIDGDGIIKEFLFENESLVFPDRASYKESVSYIRDVIKENYDLIIESGGAIERKVNISELNEKYRLLKNIDINSEFLRAIYPLDMMFGFGNYYGIRKIAEGEREIILLQGRGDIIYDNTDPFSEEICEWLLETVLLDSGYMRLFKNQAGHSTRLISLT